MRDCPETLGEHLRLKRIDTGLTHIQVAQLLGVAYQTVERWEHKRTPITSKNRLKIISFLGYEPIVTDAVPAGDAGAGIL